MLDEDAIVGLALAVRQLQDPTVTVSGLQEAIADGRLKATEVEDRPGFFKVRLGDVIALKSAPVEVEQKEAPAPKKPGLRIKG